MKSHLDADQVQSPMADVGVRHDHAYFEGIRRRLRWKLLVAYVPPLVVLAVVFHFLYAETALRGINNHLQSIAENRRNMVDLYLQERVANLSNALRAPAMGAGADQAVLQHALEELRRDSPSFVDLGLFGPDGTLRSYAGPFPDLLGRDYKGETWYKQLVEGGRNHYISDVYLGFRKRPHFIIATLRLIGDQPWILRASVDPEKFADFVARSRLIEQAEVFIINSEGRRQTFTQDENSAHPPKPVPVRRDEVRPADKGSDALRAEAWLTEDDWALVVPAPPRSSETLVEETETRGQEVLRAVAWLTATDWALVVRVPTRVAYAGLWRARTVITGIMLVALAVILIVVLTSTRRMVARLEAADTVRQDLTSQLFDAAKLASVGEMAAGVAHEINNPLAIIYEEASMILDILNPEFGMKLEEADLKERLEAVKSATMRGRTITRNLLAFARKQDPNPKPLDLNKLIQRALRVKETAFSVSNISTEADLQGDLPLVLVNPNQLDQVLLNLFNNAKDAMEEGGTLSVRSSARDGWIRVDIRDTGCGMPPDVLQQIFFPFYTTKAVGQGTGLGLSISYGIIKSFGGRIEVNSEVGQGTVFSIHLPVADQQTLARLQQA